MTSGRCSSSSRCARPPTSPRVRGGPGAAAGRCSSSRTWRGRARVSRTVLPVGGVMMDELGQDLPLTVGARIEEACDRFEAAWKAGPAPRLEDYLGAIDASARPELLRHLLAVELAYRRRLGE